jgi:hypothetical protein
MDVNTFLVSFVFGMIGLGMFMYGKKAGRMPPLLVGLALMVVPYFFSSILMMTLSCSALIVIAYLLRDSV